MVQIQEAVVNLVIAGVVGVITYAAQRVGSYFNAKGIDKKLESKRTSIDIAVNAVEQIAKNEGIDNKFEEAKNQAIEILRANGIKISEVELEAMIEDSVAAMKNGYAVGLNKNEMGAA